MPPKNLMTVYHGCSFSKVAAIATKIKPLQYNKYWDKVKTVEPEEPVKNEVTDVSNKLIKPKEPTDPNQPSDFTAMSEFRGFYTTQVERFARGWAESTATSPGDIPAVIKFELDLKDLNVYDFKNETKGKLFEEWQQFVFDNYMDEPPNHRHLSGFDIIMGFMSNADDFKWNAQTTRHKIQPHKFVGGGLMTQVAARKDKAIEMQRWKVVEVTRTDKDKKKWFVTNKADWSNPLQ